MDILVSVQFVQNNPVQRCKT